MASKPLLVGAALFVAGGIAVTFLAASEPKAPEGLGTIATELDAKLRETAVGVHARADTLANLPTMKTSVSTDAETVRNQTQTELAFRTNPGEIITIAQVPKAGAPTVLIVLPEGSPPMAGVDHDGPRAEVAGGRLRVGDVLSITPQYRADELRGALAVSWPIDLASVTKQIDATGGGMQLQIGSETMTVGAHAIITGEEPHALSLTSDVGKSVKATLFLPPQKSVMPMRLGSIALTLVGLVLGILGLRRKAATSPEPMSATQLPTPLPGMTRTPTPGQSTNAGAEEIGVGSIVQDTYEVTNLLGVGGMGKVWQAQHRRLPDKKVAIKLLSGQNVQDELFARFRREAEVTSKLGHPNIIGVVDFNVLPTGAPYIVLELLNGVSLATRLQEKGKIPLLAALEIMRQMGSALDAAHHAQIVHRDLKPDNIFLVKTEINGVIGEQVKILDFGISKMHGAVGQQTQDSLVFGTPQYMSPEQASGRNSEVDARSDVWAMAAIFYEMITGELAFPGEALATVVAQIIVMPSPSLRDATGIPAHVVAAIDKALAKAPADRFQDVRSFIAALTGAPLTQTRPTV